MHPAASVIVFTVLSGAGYGLLGLLGVLGAVGRLPSGLWFAIPSMGLALVLITAGLLASAVHLGHPERAWRALSQWRSSWLSREAVAALATYAVAAPFALGWLARAGGEGAYAVLSPGFAVAAALTAFSCAATVLCTGMIYASLKPVHQWHNGWVVPVYLALALATGAVWLTAMAVLAGRAGAGFEAFAAAAVALALVLKLGYWRFIDGAPGASTPESATGLGRFGVVRSLDPPHTEENYLQKEMGFRIARKHAGKLRRIAVIAGFLVPLAIVPIGFVLPVGPAGVLATAAALIMTAGMLVERWLFFAEARHTMALYYGAAQS